ncbi:plasmid mobilization relaxosome protein MobC [Streptomyces sp. Ru73]|uniref:plasmid mobilization protein n=1 Tax=Streptomyces sp. Ru73 TaxID=2080748 RepID=UPI000CDDB76A|nr:plasmid mobilization relaxosome protein MobC [Streptomyces sp. Ru73]POX43385.1 plasmid mobilization relaxosome protein MobC [Streptomyces sp. Ru73]
MTTPNASDTPREGHPSDHLERGRASYTLRNSLTGGAGEGVSQGHATASGEAGEARHQGAPELEAATEGGSQPEEGKTPHAVVETRMRPRLRQSQQRDRVRSVRLTADELADVQRAASTMGLRVAGFLADAAVAVARAQEGPTSWLMTQRTVVEELMKASAHLARVGNNLNQVARVLNSGGDAAYAEDAVARVRRAAARVETAATEIAKR